jgi:serpin B
MKKIRLVAFVALYALHGNAGPVPADSILAYVRSRLPTDPLVLEGTLKAHAPNGFVRRRLPIRMELDWGGAAPAAVYTIGDESLSVSWSNDTPAYRFSNEANLPTGQILDTGITWADLSFSMLWWPGSVLVGEEKKINRDCYVVEVSVPGSDRTMRLWIEKSMGMLLEAQTLDGNRRELRRMRIKSIKKMDGMWVAKDLEVRSTETGSKTTVEISELERKPPRPTATAFDPVESINRFTFDLFRTAAKGDGNLFLSPYSVSSALAMVYAGARGETAAQMETVFHLAGQDATHPAFAYLREKLNALSSTQTLELEVANSLWSQVDHPFRMDYLAVVQEFYGGEAFPVDFKADTESVRQAINAWAEEQTRGRIGNLVPKGMLDPMTRLVLANAIYFKGEWASRFDPSATRPAPFHLADGSTTEAPAMFQTGRFRAAFSEGLSAIELPYDGNTLSMVVLLNDNPAGPPLDMTYGKLAGLEFHEMEVALQLPRFKIESGLELGGTLAAMGMPLAFTDRADFSGMDGSMNLSIGAVVHKAFVEVGEEGTEAAAATAVGIRATSLPQPFVVDRSFLFLIRENSTGTILFIGRVTDPR